MGSTDTMASSAEKFTVSQAEFTTETLRRQGSANMAITGQSRLLGLPEYRDVDKAQKVLSSFDEDALSGL